MTFLQAIFLGIVQGVTEFIPVSSSAHLALFPWLFNWNLNEQQLFLFGVLTQMGTLGAVIIYFRNDLIQIIKAVFSGLFSRKPFEKPEARLGWLLLLATIPAGIAGLLLKKHIESAFSNPTAISLFLLCTAALLFAADRVGKRLKNQTEMNWVDALIIGLMQIAALFPGISRSGATISGGLFSGLKRNDASRFAFLLSVPIMVAAGIFSIFDANWALIRENGVALVTATVAAGLVGYAAIHWMLRYISKRSFTIFSIYCALAGILFFIISMVK